MVSALRVVLALVGNCSEATLKATLDVKRPLYCRVERHSLAKPRNINATPPTVDTTPPM